MSGRAGPPLDPYDVKRVGVSRAAAVSATPFPADPGFLLQLIEQRAEIVFHLGRRFLRGSRADAHVEVGPIGVQLLSHADGVRAVRGREDNLEHDAEAQEDVVLQQDGELLLMRWRGDCVQMAVKAGGVGWSDV